MRAVVTGSAGFIGQHLVRRLVADGWDVVGCDEKTGRRVQESWFDAFDVCFHLASPVGPVGVLDWPGDLVEEVISSTTKVRAWARAAGARLIDVSTSEVYGSGAADAEEDPCHFGAEASARKEYAVAKLAAETLLLNSQDLDVVVVRPFNVAGPGQLPDGGFVIPRFARQALAGEPLTVYHPGTQRRAFTHVEDVVDGLVRAAMLAERRTVYNLGNPANACTISDLAFEVIEAARSSSSVVLTDPRAIWGPDFREAPDKLPRAERARVELGWQPTRDRARIIDDVLAELLVPA